MHYVIRLQTTNQQVDNTKERNKPEKYMLGQSQIIPALEKAFLSMRKNEIASFTFSSKYTHNYTPTRRHTMVKPQLYGVTTPPDLSNQTLIFEIEMINFDLETFYVCFIILAKTINTLER